MTIKQRNHATNKKLFQKYLKECDISAARAAELIDTQLSAYGAQDLVGKITPRLAQFWANTQADTLRSYAPDDWAMRALEAGLVKHESYPFKKVSNNPFLRLSLEFGRADKLERVLMDGLTLFEIRGKQITISERSLTRQDTDTLYIAAVAIRHFIF